MMKIKPSNFVQWFGVCVILGSLIANPWVVEQIATPDRHIASPLLKAILWVFFLCGLGVGIWLSRSSYKTIKRKVLAFVILSLVTFFLLEGSLRIYAKWQSAYGSNPTQTSDERGWVTQENFQFSRHFNLYGEVDFSTSRYGFRRYDDADPEQLKVLVIGDSFTLAAQVSDGEAYYDRLKERHPEIALFVYGGSGYSSLQEYMVLDKHLEEIDPDIILWQFYLNDIKENHLELESASGSENSLTKRPYYQNGNIVSHFPAPPYFGPFVQYSHVGRRVFLVTKNVIPRLTDVSNSLYFNPVNLRYKLGDPLYPVFKDAIQVTTEIMSLVRKKAGSRTVIAFSANSRHDWTIDTFKTIANRNKMLFIDGVYQAVGAAKALGETVDFAPHDYHWNSNGHRIAGDVIANYFRDHKLLER